MIFNKLIVQLYAYDDGSRRYKDQNSDSKFEREESFGLQSLG